MATLLRHISCGLSCDENKESFSSGQTQRQRFQQFYYDGNSMRMDVYIVVNEMVKRTKNEHFEAAKEFSSKEKYWSSNHVNGCECYRWSTVINIFLCYGTAFCTVHWPLAHVFVEKRTPCV